MNKLNLGCGLDIRKGWINVDSVNSEGVDVVFDLNKYPYPFKSNTIDVIYAAHIMEHLDNARDFIIELHRISKNGSKIVILTDHYSNGSLAWGDLEHKRVFSCHTFDNYDGSIRMSSQSISPIKFKIINIKLVFGRLFKLLGIEWFMNRHKSFYEGFVSHLFATRIIIYELQVVK